MDNRQFAVMRSGALLAINLLFLTVWAFTGVAKLITGMPAYFPEKFGQTVLATFPGLTAAFWVLALSETLAFSLAALALVFGEFLERRPARFFPAMLVWSLFVFVQLSFGQWLTSDFIGTFQLFLYFSGTLLALQFAFPQVTALAPKE